MKVCPECSGASAGDPARCAECGGDLLEQMAVTGRDLAGATIERKYQLLECIGEGAMGWVYRGLHLAPEQCDQSAPVQGIRVLRVQDEDPLVLCIGLFEPAQAVQLVALANQARDRIVPDPFTAFVLLGHAAIIRAASEHIRAASIGPTKLGLPPMIHPIRSI